VLHSHLNFSDEEARAIVTERIGWEKGCGASDWQRRRCAWVWTALSMAMA